MVMLLPRGTEAAIMEKYDFGHISKTIRDIDIKQNPIPMFVGAKIWLVIFCNTQLSLLRLQTVLGHFIAVVLIVTQNVTYSHQC